MRMTYKNVLIKSWFIFIFFVSIKLGGRVQVGCNSVLMGALTDIFYGKWQSLCHHRRAFRFFIDSLVPSCRFHAFACDDYDKFLKGECFSCGESGRRCASMGYYANSSKGRGKFYLMTRNKEPFCCKISWPFFKKR